MCYNKPIQKMAHWEGASQVLQIGSYVVYGAHGVCKVLEPEERVVDRRTVQYIVLAPLEQPEARYYVPSQNQMALAKLHPLATDDELQRILESEDVRKDAWIPDENQRKLRYRELIGSGDRVALLRMVHSLHRRRQIQQAAGRRLHLCDDNFLRDAERLLNAEFSLVLHIQPSEVGAYISSRLNAQQDEV